VYESENSLFTEPEGENTNYQGKTGLATFFPSYPKLEKSDRPTVWTYGVAVANLAAKSSREADVAGPMWLEKSLAKKFHDGWPLTLYIETRLADYIPSLRNLRPIPGMKLASPPSGVVFLVLGCAAADNLRIP